MRIFIDIKDWIEEYRKHNPDVSHAEARYCIPRAVCEASGLVQPIESVRTTTYVESSHWV